MRIKPSGFFFILKNLCFFERKAPKNKTKTMKSVFIILILTQIYGAFSIHIPIQGQDVLGLQTALITPISNAITDAIHNVTLWQGGRLDARLNLLTELQTIQTGLHQISNDINESYFNGTLTSEYRIILSKLNFFLKLHLNFMNDLITILIPTMEDLTATHAITSCLDVGRVIKTTTEKIHILLSNSS